MTENELGLNFHNWVLRAGSRKVFNFAFWSDATLTGIASCLLKVVKPLIY